MTNDKKAFVDKLLINMDPKRGEYETEARQSLFNMVQKKSQECKHLSRCCKTGSYALGNSPSIFLFYRALLAVLKHSSLQDSQ